MERIEQIKDTDKTAAVRSMVGLLRESIEESDGYVHPDDLDFESFKELFMQEILKPAIDRISVSAEVAVIIRDTFNKTNENNYKRFYKLLLSKIITMEPFDFADRVYKSLEESDEPSSM